MIDLSTQNSQNSGMQQRPGEMMQNSSTSWQNTQTPGSQQRGGEMMQSGNSHWQNSQISGMQQRSGNMQHRTQTSPVLCDENSTSPLCNMGGIIVGGGSNNSVSDVFPQSLKHLLTQNLGRTMLAMFLIGTQNNMLLRGVLTDVGNDYIVLYDANRDSYITGDYYSLKFVEFIPEEGQQNTAP